MSDVTENPSAMRPGEPAAAGGLAAAMRRPQALVLACVALLAALGWIYTGFVLAPALQAGQGAALGPGMGWLAGLLGGGAAPEWLQALCAFDPANGPLTAGAVGAVFAMWAAMALAMMLPTAAPMLLTYAELAETAAAKREPAASPLLLAAGYLAVWLGFAAVVTALQVALSRTGLMTPEMILARRGLAAAVFVSAGIYQFTPLKQACLTACKRPFTFFFANWTPRPAGVLRLGLRQGLFCLGCCWAAMLVMFAVGVMNVVWMAALGAAMALEKVLPGSWFTRAMGVTFLGIGGAVALASALRWV